jgi:hypothetical protein
VLANPKKNVRMVMKEGAVCYRAGF